MTSILESPGLTAIIGLLFLILIAIVTNGGRGKKSS